MKTDVNRYIGGLMRLKNRHKRDVEQRVRKAAEGVLNMWKGYIMDAGEMIHDPEKQKYTHPDSRKVFNDFMGILTSNGFLKSFDIARGEVVLLTDEEYIGSNHGRRGKRMTKAEKDEAKKETIERVRKVAEDALRGWTLLILEAEEKETNSIRREWYQYEARQAWQDCLGSMRWAGLLKEYNIMSCKAVLAEDA